ncbi:MAG: histone H1 [Pseudomonadota bacterium]
MTKKPKRPRDLNQLAKSIVDIAAGERDDKPVDDGKNPAAVALGKLGGAKGGKARANSLTPEQRKKIASDASKKRWENKKQT